LHEGELGELSGGSGLTWGRNGLDGLHGRVQFGVGVGVGVGVGASGMGERQTGDWLNNKEASLEGHLTDDSRVVLESEHCGLGGAQEGCGVAEWTETSGVGFGVSVGFLAGLE
jgi:hypothetical protein